MSRLSIEERIQHNRDFWLGNEQRFPLTTIRMGRIFFSREFRALDSLVEAGKVLTPDMLDVDLFLPDYERMFNELEQLNMDGIYSADPCTGIPWREAILGAPIVGTGVSFVSHPCVEGAEELSGISYSKENPWYEKYLEFCTKLTRLSNGRFPVGEPILRGVTDTVGSLIGQQNMVISMYEEPEIIKAAFDTIVLAQRDLIEDQYKIIEPFHGGYNVGFYHLWAPGKIMWFQEDLAALLSPWHFNEFLRKTYNDYIEGYDYSMVHLHPTAFFHLDDICSIENLSAVQITCDAGGPTVRDMIPQCIQVIESGKRLMLGMSKFTKADIDVVKKYLPQHSVALTVLADDKQEADELLNYIQS